MRVGFVGEHDAARLGDRLQARGEVRLGADDRVVHAVVAAEIADIAIAGVDAHAGAERTLDAAPRAIAALSSRRRRCMSTAMQQAGARILVDALGLGIAEEDQHRIADELVDRAAMEQARSADISVRYSFSSCGQLFRLQALGRAGEILDVGEEDRQLLALGRDRSRRAGR